MFDTGRGVHRVSRGKGEIVNIRTKTPVDDDNVDYYCNFFSIRIIRAHFFYAYLCAYIRA